MGKLDHLSQRELMKKQGHVVHFFFFLIEQPSLKNVNNCLNTNIYSYLATSGGQSYNLYLNVVHFYNTRVDYTSVTA